MVSGHGAFTGARDRLGLQPLSRVTHWTVSMASSVVARCGRSLRHAWLQVMASELLRKLLEQNKYLRASRFVRWPSRDRHQLWATAWLALRLLPGRA